MLLGKHPQHNVHISHVSRTAKVQSGRYNFVPWFVVMSMTNKQTKWLCSEVALIEGGQRSRPEQF